ncbi:acriflavin resistance protein [Catenovulum agarivorans DS-2]|uniref:Acriflavin resistance protein n=1 Tax=Catenovulum agarivorans DS-2 TaxID=1328313 RepID=W7QWX5_9ALTE|nr:efflux RND transporter permease subunit [Catenovulum agarivorans]EWH09775.1 acriflavin resistance protein [Catenovulum agarivorans DS-2]
MPSNSLLLWWIRNPVAANLAMLLLMVAGALSYFYSVEKEPFPTVRLPIMDISMRWPGAGPREIEDQIVVRFEEAIKNVEGIKYTVSRALEGRAFVTVTGEEKIDRRKFADDIREKINSVNGLPNDADKVMVTERTNREPMIRIALHGMVDTATLNKVSREIRREVGSLPLISLVQVTGDSAEEVSIEISEEKLSYYQLSFDEVSDAIKKQSINLSAGVIRSETESYTLSVRSRAESQTEFEDLIIRRNGDGAVLRLRDVAKVIDGPIVGRWYSSFDGEPAVLIDVMNSDHMNIPKMSESIRQYIERKQKHLPQGLSLTIWDDWNNAYQSRLSSIFNNATMGLILVFATLLLFLQPKVALWVSIGIATAFSAAFWLMPSFDISLNMISLFAFMMVIGIVVDDAIVIGESIHAANEKGLSGEQAAYLGVKEVCQPVIFGVLTTVIVFVPMSLLPGSTAEFTRSIAFVVILALLFSLFECLCILPNHLKHLTEYSAHKRQSRLKKCQQQFANCLNYSATHLYQPAMRVLLNWRYLVVGIFILAFLASIKLLNDNHILQSFEPKIEADTIRLNISMPENTSFERVQQVHETLNRAQQKLNEHIAQLDLENNQFVEHVYTRIGNTNIRSFIKLVPMEHRAMDIDSATALLTEFIGDIPDAEEIDFKTTLNTRDPRIAFMISGENLDAMTLAAAELKEHIATYDDVFMVRDNLDRGSKEIVLTLKPGADAIGVNIREVSKQVRQAFFGQEVQRLPRAGGDARVKVRYSRSEREALDSIFKLKIRMRDGREIPLMSVVDLEIKPGVNRIIRRDGKKVVWIWAEYAGSNRAEVIDSVRKEFMPDWLKRHPEISTDRSGRNQDQQAFIDQVIYYEGMAFLVAYVLMAVAFGSYSQPLLIMSAIPFAFLGSILGHWGHSIYYGAFSMLGILAASGVVVNDNLVLIDKLNKLSRQGIKPFDAILQAGTSRFRPILLTSLTTFIGLVPMLSGDNEQSKFLVPMVVSLAYGVVMATLVTLFFVPCLYLVGVDIKRKTHAAFDWWSNLGKPINTQSE